MYNAISLTNKNETKCGLQNKNYAKNVSSFSLTKTRRNKMFIMLFRLVLSRFLCLTHGLKTSPTTFRGGFPGKVRIPGAKYHVIGVASTRGHEKQPAATVLK